MPLAYEGAEAGYKEDVAGEKVLERYIVGLLAIDLLKFGKLTRSRWRSQE